ncbi:hypothetical protein H0A61_03020 [Koleobacter methoxysyntrophicus]|uniref:Type II secretion system protein GspF domain-containing protein n=1 Tax=Koleobacter methoxysyntrophicus TaxID=2751313 RepID=A0A8A0RSV0_9FIRM|nr:type II secretion system F family protein [Koleobacter methoxysyntrophicus]QSQ10610.1 hypothetical protein H0A61_03020 [Koleobacter methoxysyntrophicus]
MHLEIVLFTAQSAAYLILFLLSLSAVRRPGRRLIAEALGGGIERLRARALSVPRIKSIVRLLEILLARAGIRQYIGPYTAVLIAAAVFTACLFRFSRLGLMGILYSLASVYALYACLLVLTILAQRRVRAGYLHFLTTFTSFYYLEGSIMNALGSTADYVSEPLRSVLRRYVLLFRHGRAGAEESLSRIADEVEYREFRKFINFAKMSVRYGGDFSGALEKLKTQAERLRSLESVKEAGASVGSMVILIMIILSLSLLANALGDPAVVSVLRKTFTGQMIIAANAGAIIFGLFMIKHINTAI